MNSHAFDDLSLAVPNLRLRQVPGMRHLITEPRFSRSPDPAARRLIEDTLEAMGMAAPKTRFRQEREQRKMS